jgi:hypothetical protein
MTDLDLLSGVRPYYHVRTTPDNVKPQSGSGITDRVGSGTCSHNPYVGNGHGDGDTYSKIYGNGRGNGVGCGIGARTYGDGASACSGETK